MKDHEFAERVRNLLVGHDNDEAWKIVLALKAESDRRATEVNDAETERTLEIADEDAPVSE